jgi:hypothetical protein
MIAAERHFDMNRIAEARGSQQEAQTPVQEQAPGPPVRVAMRR